MLTKARLQSQVVNLYKTARAFSSDVSRTNTCDCIGIDLGTTNSCVAIMENQTPYVIRNAEG